MIGDHVYVFFTFFGPTWWKKKRIKKVNFRPRFSHFVYGGYNPRVEIKPEQFLVDKYSCKSDLCICSFVTITIGLYEL